VALQLLLRQGKEEEGEGKEVRGPKEEHLISGSKYEPRGHSGGYVIHES
jgi:hypothetical protein